jgi:hypothetical protein
MRKYDINKRSHALVGAALWGMVNEEGLTPHEAMGELQTIANEVFIALVSKNDDAKN